MKKALVVSFFLLAVLALSSPAAFAQNCSSAPNNGWGGNYSSYADWCSRCGGSPSNSNGVSCTPGPNWGRTGGNSSTANANMYNGFYQLGYQFGRWLMSSNSNPQADLQRQQMMAELQRRQAEAEQQHREEEARRLAAMYNRLSATLKLTGLPSLQLKDVASSSPGLALKFGDSTGGQAGIKGLPGIYLNDGKVPYGIPGLPGIYTGGPGQGSGLSNSKLALKTGDSDTGSAPTANVPAGPNEGGLPPGAPADATNGPAPAPANESGMQLSGLQLKTGDNAGSAAQATMLDPSKMTPQQLADVAEQFSKLPPEEQQRMLGGAQSDAAAGQPNPGATAQPSAIASLGQQAAASQAAASAPTPEGASAGARAGFDTPLGPGATQAPAFATSSQPSSASSSSSLPPSAPAATASRGGGAGSPPVRTGMTAPPIVTAPPAVTSSAAVRPSPSVNPAILPTPLPGGTRHIESVGECLSRYAPTGTSGSAPSLEDLHKKLELERGALKKLLETQKRENEDRNEWLKEMRKAAQDVAFNAIDKGVDDLFDSSKEALRDTEVELHDEIQETTTEARDLRQQMDDARKAMSTANDDPAHLAALQSQWADMEKNQIQPLLQRRKTLEGQWESTFNWETRVEGITNARDFGGWLTDMEMPCDYENDQVTCKNFKENNALSKTAGGDYETGLDGLKMALKYAAHHADQLKKLSNAAVIGTTAGKIAANATFVGEVWDTTSLMIDLSYDATVGYLGYRRLQQVQQNDAQFEKAKSILGARIDRMNAEASCYQNAN